MQCIRIRSYLLTTPLLGWVSFPRKTWVSFNYKSISVSTFYYHVRDLRKKACAIPEAADAALQEQEVVQIPLWEMKPSASEAVSSSTPSICLEMQGIRIEIHEQAGADVIKHTLLALRQLC